MRKAAPEPRAAPARRRAGPDYPQTARLRPVLAAGIFAAVHVVLALMVFDPTPHTGGDNAGYLALAQSILHHRGYVDLWSPLAPAHTQYPPVFPAILALGLLLGLRAWVGLKLIIVVFSGLGVGFSYLWLRRWHSASLAFPVALILALAPGVLDLSHWVLSDVPFWALAMLALWAAAAIDGTGIKRARLAAYFAGARDGDETPAAETAAAANAREFAAVEAAAADRLSPALWTLVAATLATYLTRSAGLPLVVAVGAWLLARRRWRSLLVLAGVVGVPAFLWWLRSRLHGGVDYVQQFLLVNPYEPALGTVGPGDLVRRMGDNAARYASVHLPTLLFGRSGPWLVALSLLLLALALGGWALRLRRPGIAELFLPLYLGLLLVWPAVWSGERFLLPALPLLLGFAAVGLLELRRVTGEGVVRGVAVLATAVVLVIALPRLQQETRAGVDCTAAYFAGDRYPCLPGPFASFFDLAEWARDSLPAGAPVLSRKPRLFWALSGHTGEIYPKSQDPRAFFDFVRTTGARYVVFDRIGELTSYYVGPVLTAYPQGFCVLHVMPDGGAALLRIREGATRLPGAAPPRSGGASLDLSFCTPRR